MAPPQPLLAIGALTASLWLSACGGGGSDSSAPPPPPPPPHPPAATALPDLDIVAPANGDLAAAVSLSTSVAPAAALKIKWDFGDGTTATEAAPQHQFARAGDLTVQLTLTNEAGTQKTYSKTISLTNKTLTQGFYCSGTNSRGWCWMPPQTSGNRAYDVAFADASTGWRVGELGEIFKTADGGRTWAQQKSGTLASIDRLVVRSATDLLAVSQEGNFLLATQDGGTTWTYSAIPISAGKYYALGGGAAMILPYLGFPRYLASPASAWQQSAYRVDNSLDSGAADGSFVGHVSTGDEAGVYYAASALAAHQRVFPITGDGGANLSIERTDQAVWIPQCCGNVGAHFSLHRSLDNGQHWSTITPLWPGDSWGRFTRQGENLPHLLAVNASATRLLLQPTRPGGPFAPDGSGNRTNLPVGLWSSFDGGTTWQERVFVGTDDELSCATWQTRVTCESNTQLFTTDDFAQTLVPIEKGVGYDSATARLAPAGAALTLTRRAESFVVSFDGKQWRPLYTLLTAFGSEAPAGRWATVPSFGSRNVARRILNYTLYGTEDSGRSWTVLGRLVSSNGKDSLVLAEPAGSELSAVEMMGDKVTLLLTKTGKVAVSRDSGTTWQRPAELNQGSLTIDLIRAQDAQRAWVRGLDGTRPRLLITRDGGATWKNIGFLPGADVVHTRLGDGQELSLIDSRGQAFVSADDGVSWAKNGGIAMTLTNVSAQGDKTLWSASTGGVLRKSADKGASWQKLNLPTTANLLATCFADERRGWVSSQGGRLWATSDGGTSWRLQGVPAARELTSLNCQDSLTVWAANTDGLLATGTGGE